MDPLSEHRRYLGRRYELSCGVAALTDREKVLLERYGFWLEALATGKLEPMSKAQATFIMVHKCIVPPRTEFEHAWFKYQVLGIFELAVRLEANLSTRGEFEYWQTHEVYRKAAFLGHAAAIRWIEEQGDAGPAPSPVDALDLSVPDIRRLEQNSTAGAGNGRATPKSSTDEIDWGGSYDDLDPAAWEDYMGGPDDSYFEP